MKSLVCVSLVLVALVPSVALGQEPAALNLDVEGAKLAFVRISAGRFTMGSTSSDAARKDDETAHSVSISSDFYMQTTPVTVGVWKRFVNATGYRSEAEKGTSGGFGWNGSALVQGSGYTWKNPGFPQTDEHPVTIITYDDALEFARWSTRITGKNMTLPTEAQWEYAYRAGTTTTYYDTKAKDPLALGWFKDNAGQGTKPVGQKKPNPWGLYDMGGNVWQWCLDWYAPYPAADAIDPMQTVADASDKPRRVLRGGSWLKDAKNGRAAARFRSAPGTRNADNGFRLVVLDTPPVLMNTAPTPTTPLQSSSPVTTNPSAPAEEKESSGWFGYLIALPLVGVVLLMVWKFLRAVTGSNTNRQDAAMSGISLRPAADGFWVYSNPSHVGAQITVNYRSQGVSRVVHARVERTDAGQFVYTGYAPETLELVHVASTQAASQQSSAWLSSNPSSSGRHHHHHHHHNDHSSYSSSSNDSSFGGYPPAY